MAIDGDGREEAAGEQDVVAAAVAVLLELVPAGSCPGVLVVHDDGTAAACSEELDGRCCVGSGQPHFGTVSCADLLGMGGCEECTPASADGWDDPAWRHAVRLGVLAARRTRCRQHVAQHHG